MRLFSYRNRLILKRILVVLLAVALVLAVSYLCVAAYLDRYVVYDHSGAHIDRDWRAKTGSAAEVTLPSVVPEISYVSAESDLSQGASRRISGVYITLDMLRNLDSLRAAMRTMKYDSVMIDLKDSYGIFYYPSTVGVGDLASSVDVAQIDDFLSELRQQGKYLIARIPAFADQHYCLNHIPVGLPLPSGALWADSSNCYWMDPANTEVIGYLETVCVELRDLGFREVVLDNFRFPDSTNIVYSDDRPKEEILYETATILQDDLSVFNLRVSFGVPLSFTFPGTLNESRIYLSLNQGNLLDNVVSVHSQSVANAPTQLVFLTDSRDTRFSEYGVLAPAIQNSLG